MNTGSSANKTRQPEDQPVSVTPHSRRSFLKRSGIAASGCMGISPILVRRTTASSRRAIPAIPERLTHASATTLAKLIRSRQVSVTEVVQAHLAEIDKVNPQLNAIVQIARKSALEQAKQLDHQLRNDYDQIDWKQRPLLGIPVTIKDEFETAGIRTTIGTLGLKDNIPKQDATVVKRLKTAGAIIIGKTNVPELLWANETDNLIYGQTKNPYDLTRTPGGSSGGEAALISAGGSPLGIGSDAAGSIRLPAHYCGLAGLKPTWGLVPTTGSLFPMGPLMSQFDSPGPLSRSVRDLAYCLPILAKPDHIDPHVVPVKVRDYRKVDLAKLKIAYFTDDGFATPIEAIRETVMRAVRTLAHLDIDMAEKRPPCGEQAFDLYGALSDAEMSVLLQQTLKKYGTNKMHPLTEGALEMLKELAAKDSTEDRVKSHQQWQEFRRNTMHFFQRFDVLICPTDAIVAPKHGESWKEENFIGISYCMPANLTGTPSAVVRCGTSPEHLPIGVQVIAPKWRDDIALAVAAYLEQEIGGWKAPPL